MLTCYCYFSLFVVGAECTLMKTVSEIECFVGVGAATSFRGPVRGREEGARTEVGYTCAGPELRDVSYERRGL